MKKQARCLNCNARLFDVYNEPKSIGIVSIKCRKCGSLSNIDLSMVNQDL